MFRNVVFDQSSIKPIYTITPMIVTDISIISYIHRGKIKPTDLSLSASLSFG